MLSLKRFQALLDSYGADPRRWPDAERAPAQRLLASSREAQRRFNEAQRFDQSLRDAGAHEDSTLWRSGEQQGALTSVLARFWAGGPVRSRDTSAHRGLRPRLRTLLPALPLQLDGIGGGTSSTARWAGTMAVGAAVLALGMWVGWQQSEPVAPDLITVLSAPIHGLSW